MFENKEDWKKYADIINLPHHVSNKHPQMQLEDRAAQFSPFAALTGHEDAIKETARITDEFVELDEDKKKEINDKLQEICRILTENKTQVKASITYFKPDDKKSGGSYESVTGNIRKIDNYDSFIIFDDKTKIEIERIIDIDNV